MPKSLDDDTREILVSFVAEGYERLDDAEAQLARLSDEDNTPIFNSVFRLFHSVKGSAGYLGFEHIKSLTHEAETLLDVFLKEKISPTPEALDVIYATIDELRVMIQLVETEYEDIKAGEAAQRQKEILGQVIAGLRGVGETQKIEETTGDVCNEIFLSALVSADMVQRFLGECADLIDRTERIALGLSGGSSEPEAIHDMFRAIHTIKGNAGFFGYAYMEATCMRFESILDSARKSPTSPGESFINTVIQFIDHIRSAMASVVIHDAPGKAAPPPAKTEKKAGVSEGIILPDVPVQKPAPAQTHTPVSERKPLGEILVDLGFVRDETVQEALADQERPIGEILLQKGAIQKDQIEEALKVQKTQSPAPEMEAGRDIIRKEIRVDTAKLDKLFELVGELITAESMVINNPDIIGLKLDSFTKAFNSLNKISREIQETTMMIRMIPLDGLFQKMTRLVRDLSRKFEKPVNFHVTGQDTEMDKNVIEQIADPLVHIIRNAIDHGIENPQRRQDAGKNPTGTLELSARYEGSEIWITVKDDGAGLNREKILAKAEKRGLLKTDPASIPDKDVWAFIFEPGFSTADVVSEVSGRGVGLDVVKKNLEKIRGRIDIRTQPGQGTEFILAIPLTMAIIDGITVRAGKNRYSLPLNDIIEFCKVRPEQVTHTEQGQETINLRSEFIPLIKLGQFFAIPDAVLDPTEGIVIIAQNNARKAALLIDEVIGNQQIVVKSLSEYLGKVEGLSGCSILGDGSVSFIIDTGRMMGLILD